MKIFDEHISVFERYDSKPKAFTLGGWLKACKNGSEYVEQVQQYRHCLKREIEKGYSIEKAKDRLKDTGEEKLKKSLPLVTVGAVCEGGRRLEHVTTRTGWIALDIDAQDNPHLTDAQHLRDEVAKIANVAFAGVSTGGFGVWALVKVAYPDRQADHFEMLKKDFQQHFGIKLDSSKGKNPNDARFYSYDPGAIIKDSCTVYKKLPPKPKKKRPTRRVRQTYSANDTRSSVETLIEKIQAGQIDITTGSALYEKDYEQWLTLGFAFADEFGEAGRDYFHVISQYYHGYRERETDDQFTKCLQAKVPAGKTGATINTFFHLCREYGITFKDAEPKYESQNPASYGFNPWTGEIFDERGYPADWDSVTLN